VDEIGAHAFHFAHHIHPHPALVHFFEQHPQLHFGQPRTDAAVDAVAKRKIAPGIFAGDVERVGVFEHFGIAVGGEIPQHHLVALFDRLAEHLGIFGAGAAHMRKRHLEPQNFLHRIGDQFGVLLKGCALIGEFVQGMDDTRHGVAGGVIAADDEQDQIAHELLGSHFAHRFGMDHHRDEVIARHFVGGAFDPQRLEIGRHFVENPPAQFIELAHGAQFGIARPIRPEGQQPAVFPRKAEQDREHPGG